MDYKKLYEEALERAREKYAMFEGMNTGDVLEDVFPELRESEDERIRKELITFVKGSIQDEESEQRKAYLDWLEKQEQKHSIDINKMVDDYANNKEHGNEEFGKPVPCMVRAYRQGLNDAIGKVVLAPVWSEEDDVGWTNTMIMIKEVASEHYTKDSIKLVIDWLKSLKKRRKRIGG